MVDDLDRVTLTLVQPQVRGADRVRHQRPVTGRDQTKPGANRIGKTAKGGLCSLLRHPPIVTTNGPEN